MYIIILDTGLAIATPKKSILKEIDRDEVVVEIFKIDDLDEAINFADIVID